jgi:hypothetical protein
MVQTMHEGLLIQICIEVSDADPRCLSGSRIRVFSIPYPNFFPSRISDPANTVPVIVLKAPAHGTVNEKSSMTFLVYIVKYRYLLSI